MKYEKVHMIWDFYDGIRSGIADLGGVPHYFASVFDLELDGYTGDFALYPVSASLMETALCNWAIFREWERRFHAGEETISGHPARGGISAEFDSSNAATETEISGLAELKVRYRAHFRVESAEHQPQGAGWPEMEVAWSPVFGDA